MRGGALCAVVAHVHMHVVWFRCSYNVSGVMFWTWDTFEQPRLWYMTDSDDAIAHALRSPVRC